MTCPTEDDLDRFLNGQLDSTAIERLEGHIDGCRSCEALLVQRARVAHGRATLTEGDALLGRGDEVGRFLILDLLGSGGMGTVYSAFDPVLERGVALKVLDSWSEPRRVSAQLALREARALARVNHPNVVTIYEAGEADGVAYIAMELVVGHPLSRWLERPRSQREVLRVFREVARGLAVMHAMGLVHRDVKPTNVLVGDDGRARLSDFGLAGPSALVPAGSRPWAAPEVRSGQPADAKSDQYSLCLTFAEALSGESVPARLRSVLGRGLEDDPARRFSTTHDLADALETPPPQRWPWAALALVVGAVLIAGLYEKDPCAPSPQRSRAIWSEEKRAALAQALGNEGPVFQTTSTALATIRDEWEFASVELCRASLLAQDETLEAGRQCLTERYADAARVAAVVTQREQGLEQRAVSLVESLGHPTDCLVRDVGLRRQPPANEPALAQAVAAIEADLEAARAERDRGHVQEALALTEPLLARARQTGFTPLLARVEFRLGSLDARLGRHDLAISRLEGAVVDGLASEADEAALQAALLLVFEYGVVQSAPSKAMHFVQVADALLRRHPSLHGLGPGLRLNAALVLEASGDLDAALAEVRLAAAQFEGRDPAAFATGNALLNLARLEVMTGQLAAAKVDARRALAIIEATRGPGHPHVAVGKQVLGVIAREQGATTDALAHFREAEQLSSRALGAHHVQTLEATDDVNRTLLALGQTERALDGASQLAAAHPSQASLTTLAECHWSAGDRKRAMEVMTQAAATPRQLGDSPSRLALLEARWLRDMRAPTVPLVTSRALDLSWRGSRVERAVAQLMVERFASAAPPR